MTYPNAPRPQWQPQPPAAKRRKWPWIFGGVVLLAVVVGSVSGGEKATTQNRPGVPSGVDSSRWNPTPYAAPGGLTVETWTQQGNQWVAPSGGADAPSAGPRTSFSSGTYEVGTDIEPGKYKTAGPASGSCYWARLKNTDGGFDAIIANGNTEGPATVTIRGSDAAFETTDCTWTKAT